MARPHLDVISPPKKSLAPLRRRELVEAILIDEEYPVRLLGVAGIAVSKIDEPFPNPYVQNDAHNDAGLWAPEGGTYSVWYHHTIGGKRKSVCVTLDQLYRDRHVGLIDEIQNGSTGTRWRKLRKGEKSVWLIRQGADAGILDLPGPGAVPLRGAVPASVKKMYEGAVLLAGCRLRYDDTYNTFLATKTFFADWSNMTESEIVASKVWLVKHGYWQIVEAGEWKGGGGGKASVFRFGTPAEVALRDRAARKKEAQAEEDNRRVAQLPGGRSDAELLELLGSEEQVEIYKEKQREKARGAPEM